jgi:hypothetical protein
MGIDTPHEHAKPAWGLRVPRARASGSLSGLLLPGLPGAGGFVLGGVAARAVRRRSLPGFELFLSMRGVFPSAYEEMR